MILIIIARIENTAYTNEIDDILIPINESFNILEDAKVAILQIKDEYPDLKPIIRYEKIYGQTILYIRYNTNNKF